MRRLALVLLLTALAALAANVKLYMKDGSFHVVREFQVQQDRVRFYSVERSDWEEIPLELVDLNRTRGEAAVRLADLAKEAKELAEEDQAEREKEKEIMRIPQDPGVYWLQDNKAQVIKQAESVVKTSKGRSVLKAMSPIPIVSGKGTLELATPHSLNVFTNPSQEFYLQLAQMERFGIFKLTSKGGVRIVEKLTFMPVTKEIVEEPEMVDILRRQLTPGGLYKIWPKEPLPPGEYAVVEFTEGKLNVQIWDFAIKAAK
jgi:hypothetical protein